MMDKIITTAVLFWSVSAVVAVASTLGGQMFEKDNISDAGAYLLIGLLVIAMIAFFGWCLIGLAWFIQDIWG